MPAVTAGAARYAFWRAMSEAGYCAGRDGFWRFLVYGVRAWRATERDVEIADDAGRIIAGRRALEEVERG